ncbi:MAG: hypothetical protein R3F62_27995 [Planctomycetota bacterium]
MADRTLRELERRWKETGSVEDEAVLLLERVHVGDLAARRLEVAAAVGHPAARVALTDRRAPRTPGEWTRVFAHAEPMWLRRAAASACTDLLAGYETAHADDLRPRAALEAVEAWLVCPCEAHRAAAADLQLLVAFTYDAMPDLALSLTEIAQGDAEVARECLDAVFVSVGNDEAIRAGLRRDLVPWLLGYADPVRERVEARHQLEEP